MTSTSIEGEEDEKVEGEEEAVGEFVQRRLSLLSWRESRKRKRKRTACRPPVSRCAPPASSRHPAGVAVVASLDWKTKRGFASVDIVVVVVAVVVVEIVRR